MAVILTIGQDTLWEHQTQKSHFVLIMFLAENIG